MSKQTEAGGTVVGALAIVLWSTTIACSRGLLETVGLFTSAAATMLLAGITGLLYLAFTRKLGALVRLPRAYLLLGTLTVVVYSIGLYLALGLSSTHQQVVEIGLVNYLWPGLTLAFSLPMLGKRARAGLWPGMLLAFAGVALAQLPAGSYDSAGLLTRLREGWVVYTAMLIGAAAWAIYSNVARRYAATAEIGAAPLFLFVSGAVMLAPRAVIPETSHWTVASLGALLYLALGPTLLANACWDYGMRRGRVTVLASLSYLTPLLSTVFSIFYFRLHPQPTLWLACVMIVIGALICNASVYTPPPAGKAPDRLEYTNILGTKR